MNSWVVNISKSSYIVITLITMTAQENKGVETEVYQHFRTCCTTVPRCLLPFFFFFLIYLHHAACGILVPRPGMETLYPALGVQSLNHWTASEVPLPLLQSISFFSTPFLISIHSPVTNFYFHQVNSLIASHLRWSHFWQSQLTIFLWDCDHVTSLLKFKLLKLGTQVPPCVSLTLLLDFWTTPLQ